MWTPALAHLHPPARKRHLLPHDTFQSWEEYLDMGTREPNSEGTGRWVPGADNRTTIALMVIPASRAARTAMGLSPSAAPVPAPGPMPDLLAAYFGMPVVVLPSTLQVDVYDGDVVLATTGAKAGTVFPLVTLPKPDEALEGEGPGPSGGKGKGKGKGKKRGRAAAGPVVVDVFSVFDVLVEYLPPKAYCLVALMEGLVVEPDQPDVPILGRACGDRVAVASTTSCGSPRELAVTTLHETMHLFGLDHCTKWLCIMNSLCGACAGDEVGVNEEEDGDGGWIHLCPLDLRKLLLATGADPVQRYRALLAVYSRLPFGARDAGTEAN